MEDNMENIKFCYCGNETYCASCKNKCEDCEIKDSCDFPWIYSLWGSEDGKKALNSFIYGRPIIIKEAIRNNQIITLGEGKNNFAHFSFTKHETFTNENTIVSSDLKGKGVLNSLNQFMFKIHPEYKILYSNCKRDGELNAHHMANKMSEWMFVEYFNSGQSVMCRYAKINPFYKKENLF